MTVILVALTFACFIALEALLTRMRRNWIQAAVDAGELFYHRGHTWAKAKSPDEVMIGIDDFAIRVIGDVDSFELPSPGTRVRQGEKLFSAVRDQKRIDFVSPVDGIVHAVNDAPRSLTAGQPATGWFVALKPLDMSRSFVNLMEPSKASRWLEEESRRFTEFLVSSRRAAGSAQSSEGRVDGELVGEFSRRFLQ